MYGDDRDDREEHGLHAGNADDGIDRGSDYRDADWWPVGGEVGGESLRGLTPGRPRRQFGKGLGIAGATAAVVLLSALGGAWVANVAGHNPSFRAAVAQDAHAVSNVLATTTGDVTSFGRNMTVAQVANKVEPAIVDISVVLAGNQGEAAGTGMILTPNGEVLTNNHVIYDAASIRVKIVGHKKTYPARVIGYDKTKDVALVQIEGGVKNLPTVKLSKSSAAFIGEQVVAIGNALDLPGKPTVTAGTITATGRSITAQDASMQTSEHLTDMLQTDAALAPGDSGGPLLTRTGQVVGMDTAAYSGSTVTLAQTTSSDVGFAIPINNAIGIVRQIRAGKSTSQITVGSHAMMGIYVYALSALQGYQLPVNHGVFVAGVMYGTGAAAAGLQQGDIIVTVNGVTVTSPTQLQKVIREHQPGQTIHVTWVTPYGGRVRAAVKLSVAPPQ